MTTKIIQRISSKLFLFLLIEEMYINKDFSFGLINVNQYNDSEWDIDDSQINLATATKAKPIRLWVRLLQESFLGKCFLCTDNQISKFNSKLCVDKEELVYLKQIENAIFSKLRDTQFCKYLITESFLLNNIRSDINLEDGTIKIKLKYNETALLDDQKKYIKWDEPCNLPQMMTDLIENGTPLEYAIIKPNYLYLQDGVMGLSWILCNAKFNLQD